MKALVEIHLVEGPLRRSDSRTFPGAGAVLVFEGVVRPQEEDRTIAALDYEAYEPMTSNELDRVAKRVAAEHGILAIVVEHSTGRVPVGEVSFRLTVGSTHRKEGIQAADTFIDAMKHEVPLWKTIARS